MKKSALSSLRRSLLDWYRKTARDLPWRRTRDPYKIWVSEIMLQQTQVKTVIPYYQKWIKRFPSVKLLAKAPLSDVLKHWAGLGYYRRVRMLHQAARHLCQNGAKGNLPSTIEELLKIPGIGRYTAGAIASIAFNRKTPILDGNVIRVLTRLTAFKEDIGSGKTIKELWGISESILPEKNPGDFNQAMMELGAVICLPKNPDCKICPISDLCAAYRNGSVLKYPFRRKKESLERLRTAALIVRKNGSVLLQRQPLESRWGGLWMFPFWQSRNEMIRNLKAGAGQAVPLQHRMTVHHGFTKYRIRLDVYEYPSTGAGRNPIKSWDKLFPKPARAEQKWVKQDQLSKLAFPSPHQKIVRDLVNRD